MPLKSPTQAAKPTEKQAVKTLGLLQQKGSLISSPINAGFLANNIPLPRRTEQIFTYLSTIQKKLQVMFFPDATGKVDSRHGTSTAVPAQDWQKDTALSQTQSGTAVSCSLRNPFPLSALELAQPHNESEQEVIWLKTTYIFLGLAQFSANQAPWVTSTSKSTSVRARGTPGCATALSNHETTAWSSGHCSSRCISPTLPSDTSVT